MIHTNEIFDDRKNEIEFYYSIMLEFDSNQTNVINTIDNARFFRIMKSNFILMLYNIVESTISSGIQEIYENLMSEHCTYNMVIEELQNLWRNYKISEVYRPESKLSTYTNKVKEMVGDITSETPILFYKNMSGLNGNLNARQIKRICDIHKIRYSASDDDQILDKVRKKRNALAHGDDSFSRCTRDLTLDDLECIKDTVFQFLGSIITGMNDYCEQKLYLKH